jgi:hypothetical protein
MAYISAENIQDFAREYEGLPSAEAWELLANAACLQFDTLTEVPAGFYEQAGTESAQKVFNGSGIAYMALPPFVAGSLDIESATINGRPFEIEIYLQGEEGRQYLIDRKAMEQSGAFSADLNKNRFVGFPFGGQIALSALWGFSEVPADLRLACIQIALYIWRQSDPSFATISNADNQLILRELPPSAILTVEKYRQKYTRREVFA